jgi:hypothetical protein
MCHWAVNLFVNEEKICRSVVRMIDSQQQKPQLPKLPFQPYVHTVCVCALPPADSDTDEGYEGATSSMLKIYAL